MLESPALGLQPLVATRVVARPDVLDRLDPGEGLALRTAPDEVLVVGRTSIVVDDDHAIVFDDTGWAGVWLTPEQAAPLLATACEFSLPTDRPALVQGMVAQIAAKLWLEPDRVLIAVPVATAAEFAARAARLTGAALQ